MKQSYSTKNGKLHPMSPEQLCAVNVLKYTERNVVINACAGSGKTTTVLHLAMEMPEKKFLVLVFNRRLKEETGARIQALGLENIIVYNYHALGHRFYTKSCTTDYGIKRAVEFDLPVIAGQILPEFDVLVLDEQQDMTPILFQFTKKLVKDSMGFHSKNKIQFCLLGDIRQEIYGYNGADSRFLTLGDRFEIFGELAGGSGKEFWESITMNLTHRMTKETARFLNAQVIKPPTPNDGIFAISSGLKPLYIICKSHRNVEPIAKNESSWSQSRIKDERVWKEVRRQIDQYGEDQTLILAPSIRRSIHSPITRLANNLSLWGYTVDISTRLAGEQNQRGKVLISNFHRVKGTERDAVIILGFDSSYHTYYNKKGDQMRASNALYVALTRGSKILTMIHDFKHNFLPFLNPNTLNQSCRVVENRKLDLPEKEEDPYKFPDKIRTLTVTGLIESLPTRVLSECLGLLELDETVPRGRCGPDRRQFEIPIKDGTLLEFVGDITGTAIPAIFEWSSRKTCFALKTVLDHLKPNIIESAISLLPRSPYIEKLEQIDKRLKDGEMDIPDILYLSNLKSAMLSGYIAKVINISPSEYNWITREDASIIYHNLKRIIIGRKILYEYSFSRYYEFQVHGDLYKITIQGIADIMRKDSLAIWELKSGDSWNPEDFIQLALYAALLEEEKGTAEGLYQLANPFTGQVIRVTPKNRDSLAQIVRLVVTSYIEGKSDQEVVAKTDEEFLGEAKNGFESLDCGDLLPSWVNRRE